MKILKVYKDGSRYFDGGLVGIYPAGIEPIKEYNLDELTKEEYKKLRKNPKDKKILRKTKKIKKER